MSDSCFPKSFPRGTKKKGEERTNFGGKNLKNKKKLVE